ncbi:MAG TPA: protein kinase [Thermoanaerobaculia bacterium]|nr:protein kinase [Thermoanaerobaculia bacterium]
MIGTTLGHYRIEAELGRGGMGEVYLAHDTHLNRNVALKLLPATAADHERLQRFQREAQAVAALNHPNVVTIFSVEESSGLHFLTMELVEGRPLSAAIPAGGMDVEQLLAIAIPLVDAVAAAHQRGVVHRDLKPGNVMLTGDRRVKVLDFGLAKLRAGDGADPAISLISTAQMPGHSIVGTPSYMSPEQAEGKPVDERTDIFSLGVILYELATGNRPFTGSTAVSVMSSIIKDTPPSLSETKPGVPAELERIIRRCLAKDPLRRYQSAYDLRNDLEEFQQQIVSGAVRSGRPARRTGGLPWIAAAIAIAVVIAGAYLLSTRRRQGSTGAVHATFSQLTSQPGVEWFPSLSSDGKWVIYSGEHSGNREIYLQSVTGQTAINLTNDPADDDQPVFSPDGERIAFRSSRDGGGIFVMGRTGEAVRKVSKIGFNPSWSPDGTKLVVGSYKMELNPQNSEGKSELFVVDVNGGTPRRISEGDAVQPSWSPHNLRIAYAMRLEAARRTAIMTIPVGGGLATAVTTDSVTDWSPVWSADGKYLYFSSDRSGSMNLWRIPMDEQSGKAAGAPGPITTPAPFLAHPTVSADGRLVAYSSTLMTQNVQKLLFDPDAIEVRSEPFNVTTGSRNWSSPDPSPDGSTVVFYSRIQPEGDLYLARSDGTGFRQVTADPPIDRMPRWSPDGQWIAFFSDRSGKLQVWKVRADGSELLQLTDSTAEMGVPVWSADGQRIIATTVAGAGSTAYIFDPGRPWKAQTPEVVRPIRPGIPLMANDWSRDGKFITGQADYMPGVYVYSLATHAFMQLTDFGEWPVCLPDNRHILFVAGGKAFYVVDKDTKAVRKVFSVVRDVIGPARLTRDGRQAYYSRRVTEGDVWLAKLQ